ncbi:DUF938 domain-containing protein [Algihabitans albus]|uniref:DUF938 domain-containing protein n=1 Tax=Algihabitans albus TaxID=2164067 RepID=UPI0035D04809
MSQAEDQKRYAPAAMRNRGPILEVLQPLVAGLREGALLLEIASGTGEHAAFFAAALPHLTWQPSEADAELHASILAHRATALRVDQSQDPANIRPPITLDVTERPWPVAAADAVLCINMIHIAPWACCQALLAGASEILPPGGPLLLYGPFRRRGAHTAASNAAFDRSLRVQNAAWGIRDLEAVTACAEKAGLELESVRDLPANNLAVAFRRSERRED